MTEFNEGPPLESIEKKSPGIEEIASEAMKEIQNVQLAESGEVSTEALTDLRIWMRNAMAESPNPTNDIVKIMDSSRGIFAMDDEKASVREKIYDITMLLSDFMSNPNDFRVKNPDLTRKLANFCERLSQA